MWKCKTCDKVNDDKLDICWGCYTPKRNNYIELGDTDVTASFDDLQEKENESKSILEFDRYSIAFIISNIPFALLISYMIVIGLAFNGEGKGKGGNLIPIVISLLVLSIIGLYGIIAILLKKKSGKIIGYIFYPLTALVSGIYLMFGYGLNSKILIFPGWIGILSAFYCILYIKYGFYLENSENLQKSNLNSVNKKTLNFILINIPIFIQIFFLLTHKYNVHKNEINDRFSEEALYTFSKENILYLSFFILLLFFLVNIYAESKIKRRVAKFIGLFVYSLILFSTTWFFYFGIAYYKIFILFIGLYSFIISVFIIRKLIKYKENF